MSKNLQLSVHLNAIDKATAPIRAIMNATGGLGKQLKQTRDQLKTLQGQQSNIDSFKKMSAASKENSAAMVAQQQKVKALAAGMREADAPTKAMSKEFKAATREAHRLKEVHTQNSQKLQVLRSALKDAGISTRHAKDGALGFGQAERDLKSRIDATNKSLADQKNRLAAVSEQQRKLSQAKASYQSGMQTASNLTTTGAGGLAAGGGALYGLGRLAQTGMEFDTKMSTTQGLARLKKGSPELNALREQAKKLGAETMFTAVQAAEGQGFLAVSGFTPQAILDAMPPILDLAKAANLELGQTSDIASGVLLGMGLESKEMLRVSDVLASTFSGSGTTLESLSETFKVAAPIATTLGISLEAMAAMAGELGNKDQRGAMAGTGISTIFTRLAKPTKEVTAALDKIKVSLTTAGGKFRDPEDIFEEIYRKTKAMKETDRLAVFGGIAGLNALKSLIPLVESAGAGKLQESIRARKAAGGIAAEQSFVMSDNLSGDLEGLYSALDGIKIDVFEEQNGALRELAASAVDVVRAFGLWANENPNLLASLIKTAAIIAAMVATGGALMLTIGSILGPLVMMKYALTVFGIKSLGVISAIKGIGGALLFIGKAMLASPIFWILAILAGAAYLIYKNWDAFSGFFIGLWTQVKEAFSGGIAGVAALIINWMPLTLFYKAFAGVMSYFGIELPGRFTNFGSMIVDGLINGFKEKFGALQSAVTGLGGKVSGWFKDKLGIRSPSRVFMQFGSDTAEGLALGIAANQNSPLKQVAGMAKQVAAAGALSLAAGMSFASDIQFDNRAPISSASQGVSQQSPTIYNTFNVYASPGMDEEGLARLVEKYVDRTQRQQQIRVRSRFGDLD